MLKCKLCNKKFKSITNSHLKYKHDMTTKEYRKKFPDAKMISDEHNSKFDKWRNSDRNLKLFKEVQRKNAKSEKRKDAVRKAVQSEEYRKNHSVIMKRVVRENPNHPIWNSPKGKDHHHYGKSNWQRWLEKYGEEEANKRLKEWKKKNKLFSTSRHTSIELEVEEIFKINDIKYISQYSEIEYFYIDFYLENYNLAFEVYGDYWHANPNKYRPEDIIKYPGGKLISAQEVWDVDKKRENRIKSFGLNFCKIFGSSISEENVLKLLEDIVRTCK